MARKSTRKNSAGKSTRKSSSTAVATRENQSAIPGVDYTENTPVTHVNLGDGSPENPHHIVPRHDWHNAPRV